MQSIVEQMASELLEAEQTRVAVPPITQRYADLTVQDAYEIQLAIMQHKLASGRRVIGKKVGLTSVAMQQMLGVNEPDYGHLLDDMRIADGATISAAQFLAPKVEAEIGFLLGADLVGPNITYVDVLMATEKIVPTLEIIDSRIADWKIKLIDTVADNGSSARVVVGSRQSDLGNVDLRATGMVMYKNGELAGNGASAAAWGHPAHAIAWLANKLHEFGITLKAGELVLPGALSAAIPVCAGDTVEAHFGALGQVSITFD
ncbi:2-keto-4-pentenoate hydratase [Brevibacillus fluminis]|uniref:2-keto-4-pentenoate hydratase n=1 Tax=Brevibacillus fluminis TaxID=511487 RepID=UPI003F8B0C0E